MSTPGTTKRIAPSSTYRVDKKGKEPWTWVRTHGKGRVFYTAWGHDERTWGNPGFQTLLERGIRWAVGDDPAAVPAVALRAGDDAAAQGRQAVRVQGRQDSVLPGRQSLGHEHGGQPDAAAAGAGRVA